MTSYRLQLSPSPSPGHCGSIGGAPALPAGSAWPACRICGDDLVAFLDLVLPEGSAFAPGSRLQIFACREHDDIAGTIYSDYSRFSQASREDRLPPSYWEISDGHYLLRLLPPTQATAAGKTERRLERQFLVADETSDDAGPGFKLFGQPDWLQNPEDHTCACGAPLALLLQMPEGLGFPRSADAPAQPNSFSPSHYCLFLGNQLYLLGCTRQCHPQALWPVLQN